VEEQFWAGWVEPVPRAVLKKEALQVAAQVALEAAQLLS
jgi:hypothetical protein